MLMRASEMTTHPRPRLIHSLLHLRHQMVMTSHHHHHRCHRHHRPRRSRIQTAKLHPQGNLRTAHALALALSCAGILLLRLQSSLPAARAAPKNDLLAVSRLAPPKHPPRAQVLERCRNLCLKAQAPAQRKRSSLWRYSRPALAPSTREHCGTVALMHWTTPTARTLGAAAEATSALAQMAAASSPARRA